MDKAQEFIESLSLNCLTGERVFRMKRGFSLTDERPCKIERAGYQNVAPTTFCTRDPYGHTTMKHEKSEGSLRR